MAVDPNALRTAEAVAHEVIDWTSPVGLLPEKARGLVHQGLTSAGEYIGSKAYELTQRSQRDASGTVRGVQTMLRVAVDPTLKVDGTIGPRTLKALSRAPDYIVRALEGYVVSKGFTYKGLLSDPLARVGSAVSSTAQSVRNAAASVGSAITRGIKSVKDFFSQPELDELVATAYSAAPESVRQRLSWLDRKHIVAKAMIESRGNPRAVSPSRAYHGLLQLGSAAWADARKVDPSLPPFNTGRYDPMWNIRAALAFWASLVRAGGSKTPIDTWEKLYAAHQQGLGGFRELVRSAATPAQIRTKSTTFKNVNNQSRESLAVVARAVEQARGLS